MANNAPLTLHDFANVHGLAGSGYAASNMAHLRDRLQGRGSAKEGETDVAPEYSALFSEIEALGPVPHDSSIFSAAAYFADLMRLVGLKAVLADGTTLPREHPRSLFSRRPDLFEIILDAKHTTEEMPYLQIVNDVVGRLMGKVLGSLGEAAPADPLHTLAGVRFPIAKPFHAPLESIRLHLKHFKTDLQEVYRVFGADKSAQTREALGLSAEEYQLIASPCIDVKKLSQIYNVSPAVCRQVKTQYGLQHQHQIVSAGTSTEVLAVVKGKVYQRIFDAEGTMLVNRTPEDLKGETWTTTLTTSVYASMYEERKSPKTFISCTFRSLGVSSGSDVEHTPDLSDLLSLDILLPRLDLTEVEFDGLFAHSKDAVLQTRTFRTRALSNAISALQRSDNDSEVKSYYLEREGNAFRLKYVWDFTRKSDGRKMTVDCGLTDTGRDNPVTESYLVLLDFMHRYVRLARGLGWSFSELDWALQQVGAAELDAAALDDLATVRRLQARLGLPPDELACFWGLIGTEKTDNGAQDLFSRTFGFDASHLATRVSSSDRRAYILSGEAPGWLGAGLKITDAELKAIVSFARTQGLVQATSATVEVPGRGPVSDDAAIALTLATVSVFYRLKALATVTGLTVRDCLGLLDVLDLAPASIPDLLRVLDISAWLKGAGLDVPRLHQLVRGLPADDQTREFARAVTDKAASACRVALNQAAWTPPGPEATDVDEQLKKRDDLLDNALATHFGVDLPLLRCALNRNLGQTALEAFHGFLGDAAGDDDQSVRNLPRAVYDVVSAMLSDLMVATTLKLSAVDLGKIGHDARSTGIDASGSAWRTVDNIRAILALKAFRAAHPDDHETLLRQLYSVVNSADFESQGPEAKAEAADVADTLHRLFGWDREPVVRFVTQDSYFLDTDSSDWCRQNCVALLARISARYALANAMGVDVATLENLVTVTAAVDSSDDHWAAWKACADRLSHALEAGFDKTKWEKINDSIVAPLSEHTRDALTHHVLWLFSKGGTAATLSPLGSVKTLGDLSDLLLIDVEFSGVARISRIKQGLNTLQRYIHRCHMGLEKPVNLPLNEAEWSWRSHYRLWEANRKTFLFPENYLDPGLRRHKTPLFSELEQGLLRGEVSDENVTRAYLNYFDGLETLASLVVVASCRATVTRPGVDEAEKTIFYVGKTAHAPSAYFYRSAVVGASGKVVFWRPWEKVTLTIHADDMACAYTNDRLYLFWPEHRSETDRQSTTSKVVTTVVTIKFSYQTVSGGWMAAQAYGDSRRVLSVGIPARQQPAAASATDSPKDRRPFAEEVSFLPAEPSVGLLLEGDYDPDSSVTRAFITSFESSVPYAGGGGAPGELRKILTREGLHRMLALETQNKFLEAPADGTRKPVDLDLGAPDAIYYREIFFHIPFLIADTLNIHQQHAEAQKWYHHIFCPIQTDAIISESHDSARYWRYRPFTEHRIESLTVNLESHPEEFHIFNADPFDAHAIADMRAGAYEKAVVMRYIDNLLDWGDRLFTEDNWESVVQAMVLYKIAQDLLGQRPTVRRAPFAPAPALTFDDLTRQQADTSGGIGARADARLAEAFNMADMSYFPVPRNDTFDGYWGRAEDRLYKIRHSLNIKGVVHQMSLFQPPIDPRQLMRALNDGADIADVSSGTAAKVPTYRFRTMIEQAKDVTRTAAQLGASFLSVLLEKDSRRLSLLRSGQEKAVLAMVTRIRERQLESATDTLAALTTSRQNATARHTYYDGLITAALVDEEKAALHAHELSVIELYISQGVNTASVPAHLFPTIFGFSDGGPSPGSAVQAAAAVADAGASIKDHAGQMSALRAQNTRRAQEWTLQKALALNDIAQIKDEIGAATAQVAIANVALEMHQKAITDADEMEEHLRGRYTNEELFNWMIGRMSTIYFQTYQVAFALAKSAERAYQFECAREDRFLVQGSWDSLHKGLMTADGLMLCLNQLEKAYLDDHDRDMEIEKTFSMNALDDTALATLKDTGTCDFNLGEALFDTDFPGHYCRRIKSIALTIPAVVGPYQNVHATLTQTSHRRVEHDTDLAVVQSLLSGDLDAAGDGAATGLLEQQVAISRGVNDSGLFELDFNDPRYLPFEGTGAVSGWRLDMRKESNETILNTMTDVIVHLRYTAKSGGARFAADVSAAVRGG